MNKRTFDLPVSDPHSLFSYFKKYKHQFILFSVTGILYNTVIVAGPILLGYVLDAAAQLEKHGSTPEGIRRLTLYIALFLAVTIFFQFTRYLKRWYMLDLNNRMTNDMRAGLLGLYALLTQR